MIKHRIYKKLKNNYFSWKFLLNGKSTFKYFLKSKDNNSTHQQIVKDLNEKGISFCLFNEIFPEINFDNFLKEVNSRIEIFHQEDGTESLNEKVFANFILGLEPKFEKESLWNTIASSIVLQSVSDAYFQMQGTKMRYYNIWQHLSGFEEASGSQLWHRDREDLQILKIFIYLTNVDENGGPFTYAPSTHVKGNVFSKPEFIDENGVERSTDEMMDKIVSSKKWITATAPKGTVVFADTHGYHKGGFVKEGNRILFTAMYVSPDCKRRYFKN